VRLIPLESRYGSKNGIPGVGRGRGPDVAVWGLHVPADPGSAKHEVLWLDALRPVEPEPRLLQGNGFLAASERIASAARHVARAGDGYR